MSRNKSKSHTIKQEPHIDKDVVDYSKMRIGLKTVDDATINIKTALADIGYGSVAKADLIQALAEHDYDTIREASDLFFQSSGIYKRACEYLAFLYKYDFYTIPYIEDESIDSAKILKDFGTILKRLDNSMLKKRFGEIALTILQKGCYYGYRIDTQTKTVLQDLPLKYCRSRYFIEGKPAVEFNMKFFDNEFRDSAYRMKVLKMFPKEFSKGYLLYKEGKLVPDVSSDEQGWYLLDSHYAEKFNINGNDFPYLADAIPAIIDLDEAQGLERKKMAQQLIKILVQKLPVNKNGDLIFDVDEAKDLHSNAVAMLKKTIGLDVLTTFADISVEDMNDTISQAKTDSLVQSERAVYNQMGFSQNIFNASGNTAIEKSLVPDESSMRGLVYQFQEFLNEITMDYSKKPKKYYYRVKMLETTGFNYQDLSKIYKEQIQYGYSKLLPQIALGHSQSEILAELYFESDVLDLDNIMIPAKSSSTMSTTEEDSEGGAPTLSNDEKADRTLDNENSKS